LSEPHGQQRRLRAGYGQTRARVTSRDSVVQDGGVKPEVLFVGLAVSDFDAGVRWYERLFGRPSDVVAHEHEVMWSIVDGGWVYVLRDPERAGHSLLTMAVGDLEATVAELEERGLDSGPIERVGDAGRKVILTDPDGNAVSLIEVAA
jgi:predicted enzyme related to lactoylglutathione lyase